MGLWRIIVTHNVEEELWVPERHIPREWPECAEFPPCDICVGRLTRRRFSFSGKDGVEHTGFRYTLSHYGKIHDGQRVEKRAGDRRSA